jgi:hypothetical protein
MQKPLREYLAMIWTSDPNRPGQRVTVLAESLDDARKKLEEEYGKGNIYYLRNEEDANKPR